MKSVKNLAGLRPVAALLAIGVLAFSLSLEGAPAPTRKGSDRTLRTAQPPQAKTPEVRSKASQFIGLDTNAGLSSMLVDQNRSAGSTIMANETLLYGNVSLLSGQLPIAKPIVVNPYDDEPSLMRARGELIGPYRPQRFGAIASGGGCSFDVECDDCDPCTLDVCDIEGGAAPGSGTCSNATIADGLVGDCSDGLFCNRIETCQEGVCEAPGNGSVGGPSCAAGEVCDEFENECAQACTSDASCSDKVNCNGVELCCGGKDGTGPNKLSNGSSCPENGVCHPSINPCGAGADCSELT
ncbi:MAG: hypothetical protein IID38_11955, partial [Planctomycetes bacterium]|nr:hypothetical protein [Planctomycetota bacterium]